MEGYVFPAQEQALHVRFLWAMFKREDIDLMVYEHQEDDHATITVVDRGAEE